MSKKDFDELVEKVIKQRSSLASMRPVVEKEILHYDIFKALSSERLLDSLVFQGGTSLRLCRGALVCLISQATGQNRGYA